MMDDTGVPGEIHCLPPKSPVAFFSYGKCLIKVYITRFDLQNNE